MLCEQDWVKIKIGKRLHNEAVKLGKARNEKSKRFGQGLFIKTERLKTGEDTHYLGCLSELIVSKHFKCKMNKEIYDNHGDSGHDLIINGKRAEVKLTTYINDPYLRVPIKNKSENIDIYILCSTDYEFVYIVGWIEKEELLKEKPRKLFKTGPTNYIMGCDKLKPISELLSN